MGCLWDFHGISGRFTGDLWKMVGFRYGTSGCFQHAEVLYEREGFGAPISHKQSTHDGSMVLVYWQDSCYHIYQHHGSGMGYSEWWLLIVNDLHIYICIYHRKSSMIHACSRYVIQWYTRNDFPFPIYGKSYNSMVPVTTNQITHNHMISLNLYQNNQIRLRLRESSSTAPTEGGHSNYPLVMTFTVRDGKIHHFLPSISIRAMA